MKKGRCNARPFDVVVVSDQTDMQMYFISR